MTCKHCGQFISEGIYPIHLDGLYRGKHSCDPGDSLLPYGYAAGAEGEPCNELCIGSVDGKA